MDPSQSLPVGKCILAMVLASAVAGFFYYDLDRYLSFEALKTHRDALLVLAEAHYGQLMHHEIICLVFSISYLVVWGGFAGFPRAMAKFHPTVVSPAALSPLLSLVLTLEDPWISCLPKVHALLLWEDTAMTACVFPAIGMGFPATDKGFPDSHLESPTLTIPFSAPEGGIDVTGPTGRQTLYAILSTSPWPEHLSRKFEPPPVQPLVLDNLAGWLRERLPEDWRLLKKVIEVYQALPSASSSPIGVG